MSKSTSKIRYLIPGSSTPEDIPLFTAASDFSGWADLAEPVQLKDGTKLYAPASKKATLNTGTLKETEKELDWTQSLNSRETDNVLAELVIPAEQAPTICSAKLSCTVSVGNVGAKTDDWCWSKIGIRYADTSVEKPSWKVADELYWTKKHNNQQFTETLEVETIKLYKKTQYTIQAYWILHASNGDDITFTIEKFGFTAGTAKNLATPSRVHFLKDDIEYLYLLNGISADMSNHIEEGSKSCYVGKRYTWKVSEGVNIMKVTYNSSHISDFPRYIKVRAGMTLTVKSGSGGNEKVDWYYWDINGSTFIGRDLGMHGDTLTFYWSDEINAYDGEIYADYS